MKESCQTSKILQTGIRLIKLFSCKHMLAFKQKEGSWWRQILVHREQNHRWRGKDPNYRSRGRTLKPQRTIPRTWNIMEFPLLDFYIWVEPVMLFFLPFFPFCDGNVYNCTMPIPPLYFGTDTLFSSFTDPEIQRNFASRWIIPRVSPMPDLDYLDDEIWDFWADYI